ncbi:MAG: ZIP family metal transporter [Bergeyella zoohelcum]|nr:ZIP family metal transporter [Bergeyella zoohelcum]
MIIILLVLSVLVGVVLGKLFGHKNYLVKPILIISAGFLITICLNEVFPEVYHIHTHENHSIGLWVIGGVLLQMFLENFTKGFEHGHFHHQNESKILPIGLVVGLFIHAFIEGIPLAKETNPLSPYLQGILIHNLPISFILGAFLFSNQKFSTTSWLIVSLFAIASPLGIILGDYFPTHWQSYFLAIVGGIFLHISSVIIFESNKNHNVDWAKMAYVIFGVALAMLAHTFHHHEHIH